MMFPVNDVVRRAFLLVQLISACVIAHAQVVPDLLTQGHFRPYLTEAQKQEQLVKAQYPKTSQELYPELYRYTNPDHLAPLKGTPADPANVFKNQAQIGFTNPNPVPATSPFTGNNAYQNQLAAHEADMAAYREQQLRSQQILEEANKALYTPTVNYTLGVHKGEKAERFVKAYTALEAMLSGQQPIDLLKAVWMVEGAYDASLSWQEFNDLFQNGVQVISQLMIQNKFSPTDNLSKIMAIYQYMADTTKVYLKAKERNIVSKPMLYDFEDFAAKKDITKVFVSKLLRTGSGQCMSLPMLFYLYAKTFKADAHLAFAPQHSYITFKDNLGNWQNIELTGRMFISSDFHWQSGFITAEQVKSGIYLNPASEKETVAYLLTTLALTYVRTFGTDDRVLQMATTAKEHFPKNLTANMIYAGYYKDLYENIIRQYNVYQLPEDKFNNDKQLQAIEEQALSAVRYVKKDLGYREVPDWAYKRWLDGVNESARRQQHLVKRRELEQQLNRSK